MKTTRRSFIKKSAALPAALSMGAILFNKSLVAAVEGSGSTSCTTGCHSTNATTAVQMEILNGRQIITYSGTLEVTGQACLFDLAIDCVYTLSLYYHALGGDILLHSTQATASFTDCPGTPDSFETAATYFPTIWLQSDANLRVVWSEPECSDILPD